jgi:hypothetical protein
MNRYQVCKIVFAHSMQDILDMEKGGEIINIELKEEIKDPGDIGFVKTGEHGEGHKMVSKIRKRS